MGSTARERQRSFALDFKIRSSSQTYSTADPLPPGHSCEAFFQYAANCGASSIDREPRQIVAAGLVARHLRPSRAVSMIGPASDAAKRADHERLHRYPRS